MIHEYCGDECSSFDVDAKELAFTHTQKRFVNQQKKVKKVSVSTFKEASSRGARGLWLAVQKELQRLFLPEGYPSSVTDDLLPVAKMEFIQQICGSINYALATRAVLMGIGVGEATANASSSTISWVMRDGVRLVASILFAGNVSSNLDQRSKTWRMVADICSDLSAMVDVLARWFPGLFLWLIAFAACIKAVVGVCATGCHASFAQHFAKIGNMSDVTTKAVNRENVAGFFGLICGSLTMCLTPADSLTVVLTVFLLFTFLHIFANYRCMRCYVMTSINAPRLEVCIDAFQRSVARELEVRELSSSPEDVAAACADSSFAPFTCSPKFANNNEQFFVLPMPPVSSDSFLGDVLLCAQRVFPRLKLRIRFGVPLKHVFCEHGGMNDDFVDVNPTLIQHIEESLACRGVALLYNAATESYFAFFPEYFTSRGEPVTWEPYRRRAELLRLAQEGESNPEEAFQLLERDNRVLADEKHGSLMLRQLWAFFYAYYHYNGADSDGLREVDASGFVGMESEDSSLMLINGLRGDGVLDVEHQTPHPFYFSEQMSMEVLSEKSSESCPHDELFPLFIRFVVSLKHQGFRMDRLLVHNEGWTVAIHHS